MKIAVIPARGGSKRIPRKNIRTFFGKPMIAWSIEAARAANIFDHIIVSTDDSEIAKVAGTHGAEVPFIRPENLADDHADTISVIAHAVEWAGQQGWKMDAVCCIYATAPFIQPSDIKRGLEALESGMWDYAFSATEFPSPIFRSFKELDSGGIEMFFPDNFSKRSQDLPQALHDAAQFYWGRPSSWAAKRQIFARHATVVNIPRWRVVDIDNEDDWKRAELVAASVIQHIGSS
jgi:pseudaminic acid cytidylyltransferase